MALFVVAALVGGFYFLHLKPSMLEKRALEDFEKRFFRVNQDDVRLIRIGFDGGNTDVARSEKDVWIVGGRYMADMASIQRFFEALSTGRALKVVGGQADKDKFGFGKPLATVTLGSKTKSDRLEIGGENPAKTGNYAYAESIGKIFLVNSSLAKELRLGLFELREKRFFLHDPKSIGRVVIRREGGLVDISRDGDGWIMASPLKARAGDAEVENLLDTLTSQRAEGFVEWSREYESLPRRMVVELYDRNMGRLDLADMFFWGSEWYKGILVHRGGSSEAARMRREFWNMLEADASSYMRRSLFIAESDEITRIKIVRIDGKTNILEKASSGWRLDGAAVKDRKAVELVEMLASWQAKKLINDNRLPGKAQFSVEITTARGASRVDITNFNMDHEVSSGGLGLPSGEKGEGRKVDFFLAVGSDLRQGAVVSSLDMETIAKLLEGLKGE
ncbi:MAG: DUF4340 domain-containing protein [Geobacter sp.]|nr:DUF4340 domain-containing protein [Geobacter sp.]